MACDVLDAVETVTFVIRTPSANPVQGGGGGPPLELDAPLELLLATLPLLTVLIPPVLPKPPTPSMPPVLVEPPDPVELPEISPVHADKIADKPTNKAMVCLDMTRWYPLASSKKSVLPMVERRKS
jgi:hypothetical protein